MTLLISAAMLIFPASFPDSALVLLICTALGESALSIFFKSIIIHTCNVKTSYFMYRKYAKNEITRQKNIWPNYSILCMST